VRKLHTEVSQLPESNRWAFVTEKQRQVFLLYAKGYSINEISQKLRQRPSTIQALKIRACEWLGTVHCQSDATAFALKYHLIDSTVSVRVHPLPPIARYPA
jgi:DNA-binding NarL/FixJ family response regulator